MSPTVWYAARSAGIVAYLLLSCSVVLGVSMSARTKVRWPRFAVEEVHRFLTIVAACFMVQTISNPRIVPVEGPKAVSSIPSRCSEPSMRER